MAKPRAKQKNKIDLTGIQVFNSVSQNAKLKEKKRNQNGRNRCYSKETLEEALQLVREHKLSGRQASRIYNIPKSTILGKVKKGETTVSKKGPHSILTDKEEIQISRYIINMAKIQCPINCYLEEVRNHVQMILSKFQRKNLFNNNKPGKSWLKTFFNRHPEAKEKNNQVLLMTQGIATENSIRYWFVKLQEYLIREKCEYVLNQPSRIYNLGEINIYESSKSDDNIINDEKENLTILCSFSASGNMIKPFIVYPCSINDSNVTKTMPKEFSWGISTTGLTNSDLYLKYIQDVLYPQLLEENVQFPILLLFDGNKSHINIELLEFCNNNKILLFCLLPSAVHIIQPSIFKPIMLSWQNIIKSQNLKDKRIIKNNFAPLFMEAFQTVNFKHIKNSFRDCGIYPFNPNVVNYKKCNLKYKHLRTNYIVEDSNDSTIKSKNLKNQNNLNFNLEKIYDHRLLTIENLMHPNLLEEFNFFYATNQTPESEIALFNIWKLLKEMQKNVNSLSVEPATSLASAEPNVFNDFNNEENIVQVKQEYFEFSECKIEMD